MLTALDRVGDRVVGLDAGADDYLAKPFAIEELLARLRALTRRAGGDQTTLEAGPVRLDLDSREVTVDGNAVELTAREFDLLAFLMHAPGRVFTREQIYEGVWGFTLPRREQGDRLLRLGAAAQARHLARDARSSAPCAASATPSAGERPPSPGGLVRAGDGGAGGRHVGDHLRDRPLRPACRGAACRPQAGPDRRQGRARRAAAGRAGRPRRPDLARRAPPAASSSRPPRRRGARWTPSARSCARAPSGSTTARVARADGSQVIVLLFNHSVRSTLSTLLGTLVAVGVGHPGRRGPHGRVPRPAGAAAGRPHAPAGRRHPRRRARPPHHRGAAGRAGTARPRVQPAARARRARRRPAAAVRGRRVARAEDAGDGAPGPRPHHLPLGRAGGVGARAASRRR